MPKYCRPIRESNSMGIGKRLIVLHIGLREGFFDESLICFESKINSNSNYYSEMNGDNFFQWFKNILSLYNDNTAIILDNMHHTI